MDQLKEILKQAIKYRFWIALGVSALLPMIAYFVGVGPVKEAAAKEAASITSAEKDVKQYSSGTVPNEQYRPIVAGKTEELSEDVGESWKKLYARQAPLLTWPDRVQERFSAWGRKWPENVDASAVSIAINEYVNAYPKFVTEVYKSFNPFDPAEGTGVVSAPPEEALLRPSKFTEEKPPELGQVWAAQERLWIQRTLLDVVAQVNKGAKAWDSAIIKQVNALEVGSPTAQDQRSIAKGETLEEAPVIRDPSKPEEPAADAAAEGPMAAMMASMGGAGTGGGAQPTDTVSYIKTESTQFKVLPVHMSVLIEQDRIQDFLIGLENSPMTIQVMDFEFNKPEARVAKPVKGNSMAFGGGSYSMMMMMGAGAQRSMMGGMSGFGGRFQQNQMSMMSMMSEGMGRGAMGGASASARKGVDKRQGDSREKTFEKNLEAAKKSSGASLHDPYYNVVEVKIWGQARFFNPPTAEAPAEPSQSEAAAPKAEGEATKKEEAPKAEGEAEAAKKEEAPKADASKDDSKTEAPKAEGEAAKKEGAPKAEAPKAEAAKAEAPKDAPKAEAPKDAPKAEAPKDAPKAEAKSGEPKSDAPKAEAGPSTPK